MIALEKRDVVPLREDSPCVQDLMWVKGYLFLLMIDSLGAPLISNCWLPIKEDFFL